MIKLESSNNYLFVTLADGNKYSGFATNFEFQQENEEDTFDLLYKNNLIADGIIYSDFTDETETPFASVQAFKDFYTLASGVSSEGLTNSELRATPIEVTVTNQIDLTIIQDLLTEIKDFCLNIDENTNSVEIKIDEVINALNNNHGDTVTYLSNIITELQGLNTNTDELEAKLLEVISNQTNTQQITQLALDSSDSYAPEQGNVVGFANLQLDPENQLKTRSLILTDEGNIRSDFIDQSEFDNNFTTNTTVTVTASKASLSSGTAAGTRYWRLNEAISDYSPIKNSIYTSISQRIANQTIQIGLFDDPTNPENVAYFELSGTVNTVVTTVSKSASTTGNSESNTVSFPSGITSATVNEFEIHHSTDSIDFFIDGELIASHYLHIPAPKAVLSPTIKVINAATVTNTIIETDLVLFENLNRVEISSEFHGHPINVEQTGDQHRIYGKRTTTATTADQVLLTYTVPTGKTMFLLGYYLESDNTGGTGKIGRGTITTEPVNTFQLDGNFFRVNSFNDKTTTVDNKQNEDFAIPRRVAYSGETFGVYVTPRQTASTNWRCAIEFILK